MNPQRLQLIISLALVLAIVGLGIVGVFQTVIQHQPFDPVLRDMLISLVAVLLATNHLTGPLLPPTNNKNPPSG